MKEGLKRFLFVTMLTGSLCAWSQQQNAGDREAFHAAFEACLSENNLEKPERGQQPSEEDRATMQACLDGKGFSRPSGAPPEGEGRGGRHPHHERREVSSESSASTGQQ